MTALETIQAKRWIPTGSTKVVAKDCNAVAYIHEQDDTPYGLVYMGRAEKPTYNHRFKSLEQRENFIRRCFAEQKRREDDRAKRRTETSKPHGLEIGSIFYTSWGYDQTNVNFYQVTRVIGSKMLALRPIRSTMVEDNGPSVYVTADVGNFCGEEMRRKCSNGHVRIDQVEHGFLWDGKPKHQTGFGWGH